jgi:histidinol dehydrogenase
VASGDYAAGPSHCLPTGTSARFSSGLTANAFLKSTSLVRYNRDALARDARALEAMARAENLPAHGRSVSMRLED